MYIEFLNINVCKEANNYLDFIKGKLTVLLINYLINN
jgi:hypothetical protein